MKRAALLSAVLALAGGCNQPVGGQALGEPPFERHWPSHVAVSDEFRITARFPPDKPVCVSDSGTHIHGFHQLRDGDCAERTGPRYLSVWADHNAMEWDWDKALAETCQAGAESFVLALEPTAGGRLGACLLQPQADPGAGGYSVVAVYAPDGAAGDLPDMIYTVRLRTTDATKEADLAAFRAFFRGLILAGSSFQPATS